MHLLPKGDNLFQLHGQKLNEGSSINTQKLVTGGDINDSGDAFIEYHHPLHLPHLPPLTESNTSSSHRKWLPSDKLRCTTLPPSPLI